jgi:hypothetical protein
MRKVVREAEAVDRAAATPADWAVRVVSVEAAPADLVVPVDRAALVVPADLEAVLPEADPEADRVDKTDKVDRADKISHLRLPRHRADRVGKAKAVKAKAAKTDKVDRAGKISRHRLLRLPADRAVRAKVDKARVDKARVGRAKAGRARVDRIRAGRINRHHRHRLQIQADGIEGRRQRAEKCRLFFCPLPSAFCLLPSI